MERKEQIAQKIAKFLETEKCTVNESQTILRETEIIIDDSTFTVQDSKPVKQTERIRGAKVPNADPFEIVKEKGLTRLNRN